MSCKLTVVSRHTGGRPGLDDKAFKNKKRTGLYDVDLWSSSLKGTTDVVHDSVTSNFESYSKSAQRSTRDK